MDAKDVKELILKRFPNYNGTNDFGFCIKVFHSIKDKIPKEKKIDLVSEIYRHGFRGSTGHFVDGAGRFLAEEASKEDKEFNEKIKSLLSLSMQKDQLWFVNKFISHISNGNVLEFWVNSYYPELNPENIWKRYVKNRINHFENFKRDKDLIRWYLEKNDVKVDTENFYAFIKNQNLSEKMQQNILDFFIKSGEIDVSREDALFFKKMDSSEIGSVENNIFQRVLFVKHGDFENKLIKNRFDNLLKEKSANGSCVSNVFQQKKITLKDYLCFSENVSVSAIQPRVSQAMGNKDNESLIAIIDEVIDCFLEDKAVLNKKGFVYLLSKLMNKKEIKKAAQILVKIEQKNEKLFKEVEQMLGSNDVIQLDGYKTCFHVNTNTKEFNKDKIDLIKHYVILSVKNETKGKKQTMRSKI